MPNGVVDALDKELDRLQTLGVIYPVNCSAWAAPVVVVKKPNGSLRVCGDYSAGLNSALEVHQYSLPVQDNLFSKLNGDQIFSKIDFSDAYLQVEVDTGCREFLTINTHRGLFHYNCLRFGTKCASAIFQQVMNTMLADLPFAAAYLDDIIIANSSKEDWNFILNGVYVIQSNTFKGLTICKTRKITCHTSLAYLIR